MKLLQVRYEATLLKMNTLWIYASFFTCSSRCPRGLRITEIMEAFYLYRLLKNIKTRSRAGLAATKQILEETIDVLITKQLGEISFHTLRDGFVNIYQTDSETVENAVRLFFDGKLKRLERYTHKKD